VINLDKSIIAPAADSSAIAITSFNESAIIPTISVVQVYPSSKQSAPPQSVVPEGQ